MNRIHTHPQPEKLQIKFHHENPNPQGNKEVKKDVSLINSKSEYTNLQQGFHIREEADSDLQREFEIEYEQFLTNICGSV